MRTKRRLNILALAAAAALAGHPAKLHTQPIPRLKGFDKGMVAFLYKDTCPTNPCVTNFAKLGTCFFISVPFRHTPGNNFYYIVTAKHVLFGEPGAALTRHVVVRSPHTGSGIAYFAMTLTPENVNPTNALTEFDHIKAIRIFTHPDPSVDLAVIEASPPTELARITPVPYANVAARQALKDFAVSPGDEMFFLGMFTPFVGSQDNFSVFHFGHLAALSAEKVPWDKEPAQELLLMDAMSFPGNSGSPAFFLFDEIRNPGNVRYLLAGAVKGGWSQLYPVEEVNTRAIPASRDNMGITAIVPAQYIRDIIELPALQADRDLLDHPSAPPR
jgi:hypothetical protein